MAKTKRTTKRDSLQDIAARHGYLPGDVSIERMAEDGRRLRQWAAETDRGLVPDELSHLPHEQARGLVQKELIAYMAYETKLLPYFYPSMQSTESRVQVSGELTLYELLRASSSKGSDVSGS